MVIKALQTFAVRPSLPEPLRPLAALATNLRWVWHPPTQELFRWADPALWESTGNNPVTVLARLAPARLDVLARDTGFLEQLQAVERRLKRYLENPRWAQQQDPPLPRVAYFSPEFGITHVMQTYSGGLGVLAGDHLKAASDLGLDLVGVGLLYRVGYFRQHLDASGWQQEHYPDINPSALPLQRVEEPDGTPATVSVRLVGSEAHCHIWKVQVGRVPLLLLDTDVPGNSPEDRAVTDRLYGGDVEHRLRQEIVLGIGGVRALERAAQLGALPAVDGRPWEAQVFHSNEGHAGFLSLERIRRFVTDAEGGGVQFAEAAEAARASTVFTTHTPVPAGIDMFSGDLMGRYFTDFAHECGIGLEQLLALGRPPAGGDGVSVDTSAPFNMAYMGLRLSSVANGVSQLHGQVSRGMFARLWPAVDVDEVPIRSITNGVHASTWVGREMAAVFDRYLAPDWYHNPDSWDRIDEIPDELLWRARARSRERMVATVRRAVRQQAERRGEPRSVLAWADQLLDPEALTIGFARRFAEYKRGTLLLRQPERLRELVLALDRPVQFVFAGKAHPRDEIGKSLIQQLVRFTLDDPQLRTRIVFVEDYDMQLAKALYAGADIWLNNPRRPYEACGTSGEKAVLNGGLHCSTLDGWWDEMYDGANGFAIGSADEHGDVEHQDAADAQSLYDVLERVVVPMFYDRSEGPWPRRWLQMVRHSLQGLGPRVLAERMVREYAEEVYRPLAERRTRLVADGAAGARELAAYTIRARAAWGGVAIREVQGQVAAAGLGDRREVRVLVELGDLRPEDVCVELLHGPVRGDGALVGAHRQELLPSGNADAGGDGGKLVAFDGSFVADEPGEYGLTARVVPANPLLARWADTGLVSWADEAGGVVPT